MIELVELARAAGPLLLATVAAWWIDRAMVRRQLMPPGFANPARRVAAAGTLTLVLWIAVFAGLAVLGAEVPPPDLSALGRGDLFASHVVLMLALFGWYLLGFAGSTRAGDGVVAQFGLATPTLGYDLGLGLVFGVAVWLIVIPLLLLIGAVVWALGGQQLLPEAPPALIPWLAAQPLWLRLAVALSAGVVEELFFRGFLQPRCGIPLSTCCFVLAHLAYDQPFMLIGITVLSLLFSAMVTWRQTIWPAIVAHAVFDAVQLLVAIPLLLRYGAGTGLPVAAVVAP